MAGEPLDVEVETSAPHVGDGVCRSRELADVVGRNWLPGVVLYAHKDVVPFASNLHGIPLTCLLA